MAEAVAYRLEKQLKVTHTADVVVLGGGPGGIGAAVMAARAGASVVLVERYGCLGGMASFGEVHPFMPNHCKGESLDKPVYLDWVHKMHSYYIKHKSADAQCSGGRASHNEVERNYAALAAEDLCLEAGVTILYHHTLADVVMDKQKIHAVVLHSKSGFSAMKAVVFIDCTGDADLAALAGCEYEFGGPSGYCQPMTTCFKLKHVDRTRMPDRKTICKLYDEAKARGEIDCPREDVLYFSTLDDDVVHFNTTRVLMKSAVNGVELSEAEIESRRQLREYIQFLRKRVPGFEQAELMSMAFHIGVRESRRVKGLAWLTRADFTGQSRFDDAIARVWYPIDIHSTTGTGTEHASLKDGEWYEIPYGCIVPKDCDNLLVGGRPISVDHAVHSSMRVMPPACTVGSAAGMAAALSVKSGAPVAMLDGKLVRQKLQEQGAFL